MTEMGWLDLGVFRGDGDGCGPEGGEVGVVGEKVAGVGGEVEDVERVGMGGEYLIQMLN